MKTRNRSYKLILLSAVFAMLSCDKTLDETPYTFQSKDAVYGTEASIQSALIGLYYRTADYFRHEQHLYIAPHSGRFISKSLQIASLNASAMTLSTADNHLNSGWTKLYSGINVANDIIANMEDSPVREEVKQQALGEAHFIRGLMYFYLVQYWGGVPLRLEPALAERLHVSRASKEAVYEVIIADLEIAKQQMKGPEEQAIDRPNRYAAYSLLAKVYLTLASNSEDSQSEYWQKAYDEAIVVYDEGPYELVRPYSALWVPTNKNTKEAIFEIQMGPIINSNFVTLYNPLYHPLLQGKNANGALRPNKETYDYHVAQYPDDPRIASTFITQYARTDNGTQRNLYPSNPNSNSLGWPYLIKYYDSSVNPNGSQGTKNFPFMRYADVLLMLAEIENELRGPDQAYTYVNEVLQRARDVNGDGSLIAPQPADWSGMTQEGFRQRIMDERQYELLGEFHDWFDTRRRGYQYFLTHVIRRHNDHPTTSVNDEVYPENERSMLLPIPANELNANQALSPADQNPGY